MFFNPRIDPEFRFSEAQQPQSPTAIRPPLHGRHWELCPGDTGGYASREHCAILATPAVTGAAK